MARNESDGRYLGGALAGLVVLAAALLVLAAPAGAATLYLTHRDANGVRQYHLGADGRPEALSPALVGADQRPSGVATSPDGKSAYAINANSADISQYDIAGSGQLGAKSPFNYSLAPEVAGGTPGIALTPGGAFLYAVGTQSTSPFLAGVVQFSVDSAGQLTKLSPSLLAIADPVDIAIHPTLQKLYVSSKSGKKIGVMTIGSDGKLANAASPSTTINPSGIAVTPDGRFLYAVGSSSKSVAGFSINQSTGGLTEIAGSPWEFTEGSAQDVAVTNTAVYVTLIGTKGVVEMLEIDSLTGALTKLTPESVASKPNPYGIVVSPDGSDVYVGTETSVDQFSIGAGGLLSAASSTAIPASGSTFPQLAVTATGTGGSEGPVGPVPVPPKPLPPPPPPPPKIVTDYVSYQYKLGEVLVMKVTKADGKVIKTELEVGKCYPPPNVKTKCAGLVEVKTRKAGNLVIVDEDERVGTKSVLLAKGRFSIPAGRSGRIVLRPTAAGQKALKGKFVTAWLITRLDNGKSKIAGQQKIKFRLK